MLTLLASLLLLAIALPNLVIAVELVAGLAPRALPLLAGPAPTVAVLVPAHDEAAGIGAMLGRVLPLLPAGARLLVVADNCTDDTAALARAAGAEVTERHDTGARGKGHALAPWSRAARCRAGSHDPGGGDRPRRRLRPRAGCDRAAGARRGVDRPAGAELLPA